MINKVKDWKASQLSAEERFLMLWHSCTSVTGYMNFYYYRNSILLFHFKLYDRELMCSYEHVYKIFEQEYDMSNYEFLLMVKVLMSTHLNLNGYRPTILYDHLDEELAEDARLVYNITRAKK